MIDVAEIETVPLFECHRCPVCGCVYYVAPGAPEVCPAVADH